jgi:aspartate racemase
MKTIGLLGGLTWLSTLDYYRIMNEEVQRIKGGDEAARVVLYSVNFAVIKKLTQEGHWEQIASILSDAAQKIEGAGADCLLIGANTMHHVADAVQAVVNIPLIHIADATGQAIRQQNITKIGLLGTKYTMQFSFYPDKLSKHGIETMIPGKREMEWINKSIYEELGKGKFLPGTRKKYIDIINQLRQEGAEGVILGCTEIPILINQQDTELPVFDTTRIHALAAVAFALKE